MQVQQLMSRTVHTCRAHDTIDCAARIMWDHDLGVVPIVDDARHVIGIITDRDACMAAYTRGKRLSDIRIEEVMSRNIISVRPEDALAHAEQMMRDAQVRRLAVVDADGHLCGMLSQSDLVREAAREPAGRELSTDEVVSTLSGISRPRAGIPAVPPS